LNFARRLLTALFVLLALFFSVLAFGLAADGRTAVGLACAAVSLLETATASLIWIAAPVAPRW
jgi:hypothetical protein